MANLVAKLRSGAIWGVIARGMTGVLAIVSGGLLARTLSAEHLGYFFFILPMVRVGGLMVGFGTPNGILKEVGIAAEQKDWGAVRRIVFLTLLALTLAAFALATLFAGLWPFISEKVFNDQISLLLAGVIFAMAVLNAVELAGSAFFRAVRRTILGLFLLGVPRELLFAVALSTILIGVGTIGIGTALSLFLGAALVTTAVIAVLLLRFLATHRPTRQGGKPLRRKAFFSLCFPIMLYGSTLFLLGRADIWTLGVFRTPQEVAVYGAVVRLTALITFVLQVLNLVLPPIVAAAYHKGQIRKLALLARTAASWSSLLALCIVTVFLVFGRWLLGAIYGPAFEAGWSVLAILAIGQGVNAACGSPGVILQMTGFHKLLMLITMAIAFLNLIGNIVAVREFGAVGAATVTAATLVLQNAAMTYFAYRRVGVLTLPSSRMFTRRYLTRLVTGSSR